MIKKREGHTVIFSDLANQRIKEKCCLACGKAKKEWTRRKDWRCCSLDCTEKFWKEQVKIKSWQDLREKCFERDGWKCVKCGNVDVIVADHIEAIALGAEEWDINNLQTLCTQCHKVKTAEDIKKIAKLRDIEKKQSNGQTLLFTVKTKGGNNSFHR